MFSSISDRMPLLRTVALMLLMLLAWNVAPSRAFALDGIEGAGFIPTEGEYRSDQMWGTDDWINVGTELITSGGTVSFDLLGLGAKYAISSFLVTYVKPIEFWLNFIVHWRDETGQRAPEEFREMTGLMLDERVDITWLQEQCYALTQQEGWDKIFPIPWMFHDNHAEMTIIAGGFALASQFPTAAPATVDLTLPAQDALARIEKTTVRGGNSKLFERYVNHLGTSGYLQKTLGIPKGSKYINLSYHGGVNGVDGFFIQPDGKCHLLEMKWCGKGGGVLGVTEISVASGKKVYQTGPDWFCKVLYKIRQENPTRFAEITNSVKGTRMEKVMELVEIVHEGTGELLSKYDLSKQQIENFSELDEIIKFVKSKKGAAEGQELLAEVGEFIEKDINVAAVSKAGRKVRYLAEAAGTWVKWGKKLGVKGAEVAKRIISAKVK